MAKILVGMREVDLLHCRSLIEELERGHHEVTKIFDAGVLLEAMTSGEGDLVVIFGGPMAVGSLGQRILERLHAGYEVVAFAREQGYEIPVLFCWTFDPPWGIWKLDNVGFIALPCLPDEFSAAVQEMLVGE